VYKLEKGESTNEYYPMFWKEKLSFSLENYLFYQRTAEEMVKNMAEKIFLQFLKTSIILWLVKSRKQAEKSSGYRNY
jgi:hypothetical protein